MPILRDYINFNREKYKNYDTPSTLYNAAQREMHTRFFYDSFKKIMMNVMKKKKSDNAQKYANDKAKAEILAYLGKQDPGLKNVIGSYLKKVNLNVNYNKSKTKEYAELQRKTLRR